MANDKKIKTFECPWCGNPIPCNDNKKIKCPWCKRHIVPRGFNNRAQKESIIECSENAQ